MKIEKDYNRLVVLNEDCVGPRARKLADLICATYGESVYGVNPSVSEMDILVAAEIALGAMGDLVPKEGSVVPEIVVIPKGATDLEVFASGDPDWVTWEWAIAVVDGKVVHLQAAQEEAVSPLLPTEMLLLARRLAGCLQDWGEYDEDEDEEDSDEDSDFEDEEDSDEDNDSDDEEDSDEDNDSEEEVVSL